LAALVAAEAVRSAGLDRQAVRSAALIFAASKPPLDLAERDGREATCSAGSQADSSWADNLAGGERYRTLGAQAILTLQRPVLAISDDLGLTGPILSPIAACSTGLHTIVRAAQWLQDGCGSIAIAGAVESSLNVLYAAAFLRMGVLATCAAEARTACKPFDLRREGFVLGEGAGALVLETADSARRRGARPLAILAGYALGSDPAGVAEPDPAGLPVARVIGRSLRAAGISAAEVGYVNAHGTGTVLNDPAEAAAIGKVFGSPGPPAGSVKGAIGHTLGASGVLEAALMLKVLASRVAPPTANLRDPDPACRLNHVVGEPRALPAEAAYVLCLSAGFGGHVAAVLLKRP